VRLCVPREFAVADSAVFALAAGKALVQSKFGVYWGAIVAQANISGVTERIRIPIQDLGKASAKVVCNIVLVSQVGGHLGAGNGQRIPTLTSAAG